MYPFYPMAFICRTGSIDFLLWDCGILFLPMFDVSQTTNAVDTYSPIYLFKNTTGSEA